MVRRYRDLKLNKRAGRGHVPSGLETTGPGELAVICPVCPHPEINLPVGWESVSEEKK